MTTKCRTCRRELDTRTRRAGGEVCFDCATGLAPGKRIRLHPACDWFMRGEAYATVIRAIDEKKIRVQGERSGVKFWISQGNVLEVVD